MKRSLPVLLIVALLTLSCSTITIPINQNVASTTVPVSQAPGTADDILLFSIGMHIEPFGETAQGYLGSTKADYNDEAFFLRHVKDIRLVADIVSSHGGKMTIQAQSPFTTSAIRLKDSILADLYGGGHEIALHFHENAHLGKNEERKPVKDWCTAMSDEVTLIQQAVNLDAASKNVDIRYWSGGNLYPQIFEAAACAGLDVNSDWKNPETQTTDISLVGIHPWRPAGGTSGDDFSLLSSHDPAGKVVFLPEGLYDETDFASRRRSEDSGGDEAYFEYLKEIFENSLAAAEPGKVNVFHFTVHAGEFHGDPAHPFEVIERFLTEVVDPAVAAGKVRWATFSEMADAYTAWEVAHPGEDPR